MRLVDSDKFIFSMEDLYKKAGWDPKEVHFSLNDLKSNLAITPAAPFYISEPMGFAKFIAKELFENDDLWITDPFFCEVACRKLKNLGIVDAKDGQWIFELKKKGIRNG